MCVNVLCVIYGFEGYFIFLLLDNEYFIKEIGGMI